MKNNSRFEDGEGHQAPFTLRKRANLLLIGILTRFGALTVNKFKPTALDKKGQFRTSTSHKSSQRIWFAGNARNGGIPRLVSVDTWAASTAELEPAKCNYRRLSHQERSSQQTITLAQLWRDNDRPQTEL